MANFDGFRPETGKTDYVAKYDNFITEVQGYASELEAARQNEPSLLDNLTANYIGYTLTTSINGSTNYRCTNMAPGEADTDYVTWGQAQSIGSTDVPTNVTDLGIGSLLANDVLVISAGGTAITGRPSRYTTCPSSGDVVANQNYDMELSSTSKIVNLPDNPSVGTTISFADIAGLAGGTRTLKINPSDTPTTARYIMGGTIDDFLEIDAYAHCSFDLIYTGLSTIGWVLSRFQM